MRMADAIAEGMRRDGVTSIGWGDNRLVDYVAALTQREHPLNKMSAAMAAMEHAPDLFEKRYRRSADNRGAERRVRCFRLRDTA